MESTIYNISSKIGMINTNINLIGFHSRIKFQTVQVTQADCSLVSQECFFPHKSKQLSH